MPGVTVPRWSGVHVCRVQEPGVTILGWIAVQSANAGNDCPQVECSAGVQSADAGSDCPQVECSAGGTVSGTACGKNRTTVRGPLHTSPCVRLNMPVFSHAYARTRQAVVLLARVNEDCIFRVVKGSMSRAVADGFIGSMRDQCSTE